MKPQTELRVVKFERVRGVYSGGCDVCNGDFIDLNSEGIDFWYSRAMVVCQTCFDKMEKPK